MTTEARYTTHTLPEGTWYVVTYSPRGFRNELAQKAFMSEKNADTFAGQVENDTSAWIATGSQRGNAIKHIASEDDVLPIWAVTEQYEE